MKKTLTMSNIILIVGGLLILINIIGFYNYTTVDEKNGRQIAGKERISEGDFWREAYKSENEELYAYIVRLTDLVYRRMVHIGPEYTRPTFFENYLLWAHSQYVDYFQWRNTHKAIRLGGGLCSQQAFVVVNILRFHGVTSRILSINGHILNEVLVNDKWMVVDPDYNIVFNLSLREIEDNPELVMKPYLDAGLTIDNANNIKGFFASKIDNWHIANSAKYSVWDYFIERASIYLVWIIPLSLIGFGIYIKVLDKFYMNNNSTNSI